jgi:hypothetical protein
MTRLIKFHCQPLHDRNSFKHQAMCGGVDVCELIQLCRDDVSVVVNLADVVALHEASDHSINFTNSSPKTLSDFFLRHGSLTVAQDFQNIQAFFQCGCRITAALAFGRAALQLIDFRLHINLTTQNYFKPLNMIPMNALVHM